MVNPCHKVAHNIKLALLLLIFHILIYLFEPACKRAPPFGSGAMPYEDVPLIGGRRYRGFKWMPLDKNENANG